MDNLIKRLKDSNIGCKISKNYLGVFCYAVDLTLISPTLTGLKCMLAVCENYTITIKNCLVHQRVNCYILLSLLH